MNSTTISLAGARNEIQNINAKLQSKCGQTYRIDILQYRFRNSDAIVYDEKTDKYDIILCLYYNNKCISSVTGRHSSGKNSIELLSKTDAKYEGLKFNLYLRSVFMYLMCFVRPSIDAIYSYATNPISTYAMYKHYNASNPDLQAYVLSNNLTQETFTLEDARKFHQYFFEKHKLTTEDAQQELNNMLEECSENYGIQCEIPDLGWQTEEEAIHFIMNNMNIEAIVLEVNLQIQGIKEFLFNKILTTDIKCAKGVNSKSSSLIKEKRKKRTLKKYKRYKQKQMCKE